MILKLNIVFLLYSYNNQMDLITTNVMETRNIKEEARRLIDNLPEDSTWDDLMYEIYVR